MVSGIKAENNILQGVNDYLNEIFIENFDIWIWLKHLENTGSGHFGASDPQSAQWLDAASLGFRNI